MPEPTLTSGGAERAAMTLDHYDRDPQQRVVRFLTDLAEYCQDAGLAPLPVIAHAAQAVAEERRAKAARIKAELQADVDRHEAALLQRLHERRLAAENGDGRPLSYIEARELDRLEAAANATHDEPAR